jgi:plasmid replication initiation protein
MWCACGRSQVEKLTELFEQARAAQAQNLPRTPVPDRHPVRDFFVADIFDCALKDDRASMEHPFFSLSKTPDHRVRHYERNGVQITVKPGADGMATIWDKDVLIFCISQLTEAINQGRPVTRTVRLRAYDLLVATNRHTGGKNYERLTDAFRRLAGTRIETNIATNGRRIREGFGLIDNWRIIERSPSSNQMIAVELLLNEWLYGAILGREVLTLNREYFRLDGGLERRLYELARKHCGRQESWIIRLDLLHQKSGSTAPLKKFRQYIKSAAGRNVLPDYAISFQLNTDRVTFTPKSVGPSGTSIGPSGTTFS